MSASMPPLAEKDYEWLRWALDAALERGQSEDVQTTLVALHQKLTTLQAESNDLSRAPLQRIADVLEAVYDPERKALRLYDVERAKVYKAALAPEYRDKFGMDAAKPEAAG